MVALITFRWYCYLSECSHTYPGGDSRSIQRVDNFWLFHRVHTQSSMHAAYSKDETVQDALDIIKVYRYLSPGLSTDRICIKIPATYEGLEACRILETQGIKTLATTLFSVEQAILADEVHCEYVAPYVNELKVCQCIACNFNFLYSEPELSPRFILWPMLWITTRLSQLSRIFSNTMKHMDPKHEYSPRGDSLQSCSFLILSSYLNLDQYFS